MPALRLSGELLVLCILVCQPPLLLALETEPHRLTLQRDGAAFAKELQRFPNDERQQGQPGKADLAVDAGGTKLMRRELANDGPARAASLAALDESGRDRPEEQDLEEEDPSGWKWTRIYASPEMGNQIASEAEFNNKFEGASMGIIKRVCQDCGPAHREVFYRRRKTGGNFNAYQNMLVTWSMHGFHTLFDIYSSVVDAVADRNAWQFCNGDYPNIGFPRDCGPGGPVWWQWTSFTNGRSRKKFAFYIYEDPNMASQPSPCSR